jgi:glucose/arabinose dehydrogenase
VSNRTLLGSTPRAAVLALAVLAVAGCGGGTGSGTGSTPSPTQTAASTAASAAPVAGHPVVVASGVPFPTNLAFDRQGRLWVSSAAGGSNPSTDGVWYVAHGAPRHVVKGLGATFGLTWVGDQLYVTHMSSSGNGAVSVLQGFDGTTFKRRRTVIGNVAAGIPTMASVVQGPGGRVYLGVPASHDKGGQAGRILSIAPGEAKPVVEATGLNSTFGLAFDGGRLLVTDNGRDDLGPSRPPDELDTFDPSGSVVDFGYPACYGQGGSACAGTRGPFVRFLPHASPAGIAVAGDTAYVAENGAIVKTAKPAGSDIQRVDLRTGRTSVFWRSPVKHDPTSAAIGPDGNLYATLYASGKVVRFDLRR